MMMCRNAKHSSSLFNSLLPWKWLLPFVALLHLSCGSELRVIVPDVESLDLLQNAAALPKASMPLIDGVYALESGANRFGDTLVLKHDGNALSVFCQRNSSYMILRSGVKDSAVIYAGYWRFAQGPQTGLAVLRIGAGDAAALFKGQRPAVLKVHGSIGGSDNFRDEQISMKYVRPLHGRDSSRPAQEVLILAHRGGGRNSDRLPFSENSTELVKFASKLGAQGVEIDVRMTKDSVPVLYHDENLNTRLVDGEYMVGPIGAYSLAQLRTLCRLKNGEQIPTLQEVLDAVVDSTNLRVVWLDIKELSEVYSVVPLQQAALRRAAQLHAAGLRDSLEIFFGLASEEIYEAFLLRPDHEQISSICELSIEKVRAAKSRVYGARWTLGGIEQELQSLHAESTRAFVWTLDLPEFIEQFLATTKYDGILTNYPTVVAYHYYVRP